VLAGVPDQFAGPGQDRALPGRPGDRDAPAAPELQQPLVPQQPQRSQDGVGVDVQHGGQVAGGRKPFAGPDLAVGDGAADLGADLVVERQRIAPVQFDIQHDANQTSIMSLITLPESGPSRPDAQALIAEARAHARRRRRKAAAALILLAAMVATGVLIGRAAADSHAAAPARPRPARLAARTGIVTGHLAACFAIPTRPLPVTPGTVVALRGRVTDKPAGPGSWTFVFPKGPAVASEHISNNYDQTFRFELPPGHYVIAGRYDRSRSYGPFSEVTVTTGATIRVELPDVCA
jgi:hypothetical protein